MNLPVEAVLDCDGVFSFEMLRSRVAEATWHQVQQRVREGQRDLFQPSGPSPLLYTLLKALLTACKVGSRCRQRKAIPVDELWGAFRSVIDHEQLLPALDHPFWLAIAETEVHEFIAACDADRWPPVFRDELVLVEQRLQRAFHVAYRLRRGNPIRDHLLALRAMPTGVGDLGVRPEKAEPAWPCPNRFAGNRRMMRWSDRVIDDFEVRLAAGIETRWSDLRYEIEVAEVIRYRFDAQTRKADVLTRDALGRWAVADSGWDLFAPLAGRTWLNVNAWNVCARNLAGKGWDLSHFAAARVVVARHLLFREATSELLRRHLHRLGLMSVIRRELLAVMTPWREVVQTALRTVPRVRRYKLTSYQLSESWKHHETLDARRRENSKLLPLFFRMLRSGLLTPGSDYQAMKDVLVRRGLSGAGWRRCCAMGLREVEVLMPGRDRSSPIEADVEALNWLARFGERPACRVALGQVGSLPIAWREPGFLSRIPVDCLNAAGAALRTMPRGGDPKQIVDPLATVLSWLMLARPQLNAQQIRRWAWAKWYREATAGLLRLRDEPVTFKQITPMMTFGEGRFHATPITTSGDLLNESLEMQHCIYDYVDACRDGSYQAWSVKSFGSGRCHRLTIGLHIRLGGGRLRAFIDDVRGFGNRSPTAEESRFSHALLEAWNNACANVVQVSQIA